MSLPSEHSIRTHIEEIYLRGIELGKERRNFHKFLQEEISALAGKFNFTPDKEFFLPNFRGENHNGYIDVAWVIGSIPIVAIEIDSSQREKSIRKLLASNANLLFWFYYGNKPVEPFVNSIDVLSRVKILHYPTRFGRLGIRSQKLIPAKEEIEKSPPSKSYSFMGIRKKYPNAYEKWSNEQDRKLKEYFDLGLSTSEIANKLQRKSGAIRSRIKKLGLR